MLVLHINGTQKLGKEKLTGIKVTDLRNIQYIGAESEHQARYI